MSRGSYRFKLFPVFSGETIVLDDAIKGPDTVLPADFLPLGVGAAIVGDGHLVDADGLLLGHTGQFGGHFRLKAKTVLLQIKGLEDVGTRHLVAGLHIGKVQVAEPVGDAREQLVALRVPVEEYAVGVPPR